MRTADRASRGPVESGRSYSVAPSRGSPAASPRALHRRCPKAPAFRPGAEGAFAYVADGRLRVMELSSGRDRVLVHRPEASVGGPVAFSPDGRWISFGGIVTSTSLRVGGDEVDQAIIAYLKKGHALAIGERSAERLKIEIWFGPPGAGPGQGRGERPRSRVRAPEVDRDLGRGGQGGDRGAGCPDHRSIHATLDACPPELAGDIMKTGILLTGGGALLKGLDERLRDQVLMPIHVAEEPLSCVVKVPEPASISSGRSASSCSKAWCGRAEPPSAPHCSTWSTRPASPRSWV
jgi:MreB/Mbl protein